jgi:hypothetical protein
MSRLRPGEVLSGLGGIPLLLQAGRRQGPVSRWLGLVTGAVAIGLPYTQATRRAPALPVALSVVVTVLGGATATALVGQLLDRARGARLGLLGALGIAVGGYASMRQEAGTDPAALGELETITLEP